jgi:hypothetical protein
VVARRSAASGHGTDDGRGGLARERPGSPDPGLDHDRATTPHESDTGGYERESIHHKQVHSRHEQ